MAVKYVAQFIITIKPAPLVNGRPRGQGVDGYGRKISTDYQAWLPDESRPYRVYATCFSNVASHYIVRRGQTLYLQSGELDYQVHKERERRAMARVTAKLANMRKTQSFSVYPPSNDGQIIVQSDRAIGQFDPATGKGVLNYKGSNAKFFPHLTEMLGAEDYQFPAEFVKACVEAQPTSNKIG